MPLYEEKVISPLALRFTQQRIRTTFRDGREVEAAIKEITAKPGTGNYDIVLQAPFPTIEIIRYSPNGRGGHDDDDHWFTFDNRRLYCLQRIAAEHWPKRVGAVVEVLYADTGAIRKKLDSQTGGLSISIGHAFATAEELESWDWRQDVEERAPPGLPLAEKAEAAVDEDDTKTSVNELTSAPGGESSLERLARHLVTSEPVAPVSPCSHTESEDSGSNRETPSTTATEMMSGSETPAVESLAKKVSVPAQTQLAVLKESLSGVWTGEKGETYTVNWKGGWHCIREDSYSTKKFSMQQDNEANVLWWGIQRTYYVDLADLTEISDQLRWHWRTDEPCRRPRFAWKKTSGALEQENKSWEVEEAGWSAPWKQEASQQKKWQTKPQQQPALAQGRSKWVAVGKSGGA